LIKQENLWFIKDGPPGVLPVVGYTGRLHPKGVPFLSSQYIKARVGKIAILVYERVTKSAAGWKKWWLKRRVPHLGRNDYATESELLKPGKNVAITENSFVLA